jgi:hypothetical protein
MGSEVWKPECGETIRPFAILASRRRVFALKNPERPES